MNRYLIIAIATLFFSCETDEIKKERLFALANNSLDQREFSQAIDMYDKVLALDPDFELAYNNRGVAKMELQRPHEAIQDYNQAIAINSDYFQCIQNRAAAYESAGKLAKSLADYEDLINRQRDSIIYQRARGILLSGLKRYDEAINTFKEVLARKPGDAHATINLATVKHHMGANDEAIEILNLFIQSDKTEPNAYNTLNQIYLHSDQLHLAHDAIVQAVKMDPGNPVFLNNQGLTLIRLDSLKPGINLINQSIVIDPDNAWAYRNKGFYYHKVGDQVQAIRYLTKSLEMESDLEMANSMLAQAYFDSDDLIKACENWDRAVQMGDIRAESQLAKYCN